MKDDAVYPHNRNPFSNELLFSHMTDSVYAFSSPKSSPFSIFFLITAPGINVSVFVFVFVLRLTEMYSLNSLQTLTLLKC